MTIKEHNGRLEAVLIHTREDNLKLNAQKTKICQTSVNYVGHTVTAQGLKPNPERLQAILDMPTPTDKAAVQRFLGMVGYVSRFIPTMADITKSLRTVIQKGTV